MRECQARVRTPGAGASEGRGTGGLRAVVPRTAAGELRGTISRQGAAWVLLSAAHNWAEQKAEAVGGGGRHSWRGRAHHGAVPPVDPVDSASCFSRLVLGDTDRTSEPRARSQAGPATVLVFLPRRRSPPVFLAHRPRLFTSAVPDACDPTACSEVSPFTQQQLLGDGAWWTCPGLWCSPGRKILAERGTFERRQAPSEGGFGDRSRYTVSPGRRRRPVQGQKSGQ